MIRSLSGLLMLLRPEFDLGILVLLFAFYLVYDDRYSYLWE